MTNLFPHYPAHKLVKPLAHYHNIPGISVVILLTSYFCMRHISERNMLLTFDRMILSFQPFLSNMSWWYLTLVCVFPYNGNAVQLLCCKCKISPPPDPLRESIKSMLFLSVSPIVLHSNTAHNEPKKEPYKFLLPIIYSDRNVIAHKTSAPGLECYPLVNQVINTKKMNVLEFRS